MRSYRSRPASGAVDGRDMPFLLAAIRWKARTHLLSGILLSSMTVPTVTENGLSHSLHQWTPGCVLLPFSLVIRFGSALPQ